MLETIAKAIRRESQNAKRSRPILVKMDREEIEKLLEYEEMPFPLGVFEHLKCMLAEL